MAKRRLFISYHHADQAWKDYLAAEYGLKQGLFDDGSLDDRIDSSRPDYVHRQIREEYITGTSATVVLCGAETFKRKYVDWEIHSTLVKRHGLLGIIIAGAPQIRPSVYTVPARLADNLPNYARLIQWPADGWSFLASVEEAIQAASHITPDNSRVQMAYNES